MDVVAKRYRTDQFGRLKKGASYPPKIKITTVGSETNWINVTDEEIEDIRRVLTGEGVVVKRFYGGSNR